mmetsp:Transcript_19322/g.25451  ORF Transcript_19322/g.25451 Transcript_19322/m.25451 type:complete len:783 (+) Transcript_19322:1-2349(+)
MGAALKPSEETREILKRYYVELCHAEPNFPVSDSEIKVHFSWGDAFKITRKSAMTNYAFEKAGVLYNLASLESHVASLFDRTDPQGLKMASHHFKIAAGIYQYIRDELVPKLKGVVTSDISMQGLGMAVAVMQAQSQACIFELSAGNRAQKNMKPALLAKLANQVSEYFSRANTASRSAEMAGTLDPSWQQHMAFQSSLYAAKAEFWQAFAVKEAAAETATGYGEQIRRLMTVEATVNSLLSQSHRVSHKLVEPAQDLVARAVRQREIAETDNRNIYHEVVPRAKALAAIGKISMVKDGGVLPEMGMESAALFAGMLPAEAVSIASAYLAGLEESLKQLQESVKDANKEARDKLAEVGLPGSLEASQTEVGLPDTLWAKVERAKAGIDRLKSTAADNDRAAIRATQVLQQVQDATKDELRVDRDFHGRYPQYEGTNSEVLCADLQADYDQYSGLLAQAQTSNNLFTSQIQEQGFQEFTQLLSLSREEVSALVPSQEHSPTPLNYDVSTLSGLLTQLAQAIAQRDAQLENLRVMTEMEKDQIVQKFEENQGKDYNSIIAEERQKFEGIDREITASVGMQSGLLKNILNENKKFQKAKQIDTVTIQREEFLQKINVNLGVYHELVGQTNEGSMFFSDFLRRLAQLFQTAQDLCYTQQLQRSEYENALQQMQADEELAQKLHNEANISQQPEQPNFPSPSAPPGQPVNRSPSYPTTPPPSYAHFTRSGSIQAYSDANPFTTTPQMPTDPKVARLCELGFSASSVEAALKKHNGDENAAANELFST